MRDAGHPLAPALTPRARHWALAAGIVVVLSAAAFLWMRGQRMGFWFFYNVPIGLPFGAFLFERAYGLHRRALSWRPLALDAGVVGAALCRVFFPPLPFVSGHTLFLTYALVTTTDPWIRGVTALVLGQVLFVYWVLWGACLPSCGAILVALACAAFRRGWGRSRPRP